MFNIKFVLIAIFLVGCVLANVQQGEDNGAYLAERAEVAEIEAAYNELAKREEVEEVEEEEAEETIERVTPRNRRGSPCTPPSSSSSSSNSNSGPAASSSSSNSGPAASSSSTSSKGATTTTTSSRASSSSTSSKASSSSSSSSTSSKSSSTSTSSKASSSSGSSVGLCDVVPASQQPLKLLVPLYVYPGAAWDTVVAGASKVETIAIINPNSGPASAGPDSSYTTYMNKLTTAGVEMVGYVYTSYGARSIADVKADIDTYANKYRNIKGIFFDEASASASDIPFYTQAYNYVISKGMTHSILNPGTAPAQGYVSISSNIVIFEDAGSKMSSINFASWVTCAPDSSSKANYKYKFSGIAHSTSSSSAAGVISSFQSKGMGLVYVTDGAAGCCTYNSLTSYYASEASTVQSLNG